MKEITCYDSRKNKQVKAGILKDKVFVKRAKKTHFMYKYKGYAIQKNILDKLQQPIELGEECESIKIITSKDIYTAKLTDWVYRGIEIDFGHGLQIVMPILYMQREER